MTTKYLVIIDNKIIEFDYRFVMKIGTGYSKHIGNSRTDRWEDLKGKYDFVKENMNCLGSAKKCKILKTEYQQCCNLIDHNYYFNILTDEEFEKEELDYQI